MASGPWLRFSNYISVGLAGVMGATPVIEIVKEDRGHAKEEQSVTRPDLLPFDHHHTETEHYGPRQFSLRHAVAGSTASIFTTVTGSSIYAVFPRIEESFPLPSNLFAQDGQESWEMSLSNIGRSIRLVVDDL